MQVGRYRVSTINHGFFRLDGGAMFGSVPKTLWSKVAPADDLNRILLATRSLIVEEGDRKLIVDLGCGDKWNDKLRTIYAIDEGAYRPVDGVTDVLLTHLHFDHAGGVCRLENGAPVPNYPDARHFVGRRNLENAKAPNGRERGSYLPEDVGVLSQVDVTLLDDGDEVWPGLKVHRVDGHTTGLLWVELSDGGTTVVYPADLNPTSAHLPVPYAMGYDICAERCMMEKESFVGRAIEKGWIVVFEHDPSMPAARLAWDDRGRPVVSEVVEL